MEIKERFGNDGGRCSIKYLKDGSGKLVTGGSDGDLHIFGGVDEATDSTDVSPFYCGDEILGLAVAKNKIFIAPKIDPVGSNEILSAVFDQEKAEIEGQSVITKFTAEGTCVDASENGKLILAGSADMTIKLVDTETFDTKRFEGHLAPLLSVVLDPKAEYAASASCDGSVKIWKIESQSCLKTWKDCWAKSNDLCRSPTPGQIGWHPNGSKMAIPTNSHIKLIERNQWETEKKLISSSNQDFFTVVAFSQDVIVGGTNKGKFVFWKLDGTLLKELQSSGESAIQSIDWNPQDSSEIAFIKQSGHFGKVSNFLQNVSTSSKVGGTNTEKIVEKTAKDVDENEMNADELTAALFDDADEDENSFSIRQIKKETGFLDDDDDTNLTAPGGDDDKASIISKINDNVPKPEETVPIMAQQYLDPDIQEPFQPGSTPVHLESRFMLWNATGIIRSFTSEDENSIDVEFHDAAIHHPIHLGNSNGFTMADLSTEAILLASEGEDDVPAKLTCHYFATSALVKEWTMEMPEKEGILAICCGIGWVAVATDRRNLRIYSVGGMQREVLTLPGPVVALSGFKDKLMASVHLAMPLPGNQSIGTAIFSIGQDEQQHDHPNFSPLPLAPSSYLAWQGFTDEGVACTMDSVGFIRILNPDYGSSWIQVCDSKSVAKGKSDHFFMVGASLQEFTARCILVKGSRYPSTLPRPVITELSLKFPLTGVENEKYTNEQSYWKTKIVSRAISQMDTPPIFTSREALETEETQALVKLFAHAVQLEHEIRAMDVCKLMSSNTLQIAIKYASKNGKIQLANKISKMACDKQEEEERALESKQNSGELSQDSEDIIYDTQEDIDMEVPENPFLAAQAKKEMLNSSNVTPKMAGNFNPFKKSTTPSSVSGSGGGRSGIVFDEMAKKDVVKSVGKAKTSFGDRKKPAEVSKQLNGSSKQIPSTSRMVNMPMKKKDKENKTDNTINDHNTKETKEEPVKGFLLYLEENSQKISQEENIFGEEEIRNHCLQLWQNLSQDEKADYKTPRIPKRKREDEQNVSTASKLARFALSK